MTLKLGVWGLPINREGLDYVIEAERLGIDSVWVPEFWAYDALTPLAAAAVVTERIRLASGIVQIGTRSPTMIAMSAMTLQELSGGRFVLGLGSSGPQVIQGWHGVEFAKPVARTRETIEILRMICRGERLVYEGEFHTIPLPGAEGKALRFGARHVSLPIHLASLGPVNLRLTGALADGWIGNSFFCETADVFLDELRAGAATTGRSLSDLELSVSVGCEITDDVAEAGRRHAAGFAFTFGAMGSAQTNFYNNAFERQGYGTDVAEVQRLWLAGDRQAAGERVPIEIGLGQNLIGPRTEILRRLREYRDCGINVLRVTPSGDTLDERLDCLGTLVDIIGELDADNTCSADS